MVLWIYLLAVSLIILALLLVVCKPSKAKLFTMAKMGLVFSLFDFVVQTSAYYLGFWRSFNSVFFIGPAVPVEVFFIAFATGAALNLLLSKFSTVQIVASSIVIGFIGALFEVLLIMGGHLAYSNGWSSVHAIFGYSAAFVFLQFVNKKFMAT